MDFVDFATALHRLRRAAGLNQAELARRAELSTSTVSRLEAGKLPPTDELAQRMGECLALEPDERRWLGELASLDRLIRAAQAELPHWEGAQRMGHWLHTQRGSIRHHSPRKETATTTNP